MVVSRSLSSAAKGTDPGGSVVKGIAEALEQWVFFNRRFCLKENKLALMAGEVCHGC